MIRILIVLAAIGCTLMSAVFYCCCVVSGMCSRAEEKEDNNVRPN